MADKFEFILGTLDSAFLQLKTTDNVYLQDLLEKDINPSLELYNKMALVTKSLFCYDYDDLLPDKKKMYGSDTFEEVSNLEKGNNKAEFDSWNTPVPITRYGSATNIDLEGLKQMSSKELLELHNNKLRADQQLLAKQIFYSMCIKAPSSKVDALRKTSATPKAFWNGESGMDTPRPNGQITFDGDHNHYLAVASAGSLGTAGAELTALIATLTEHEDNSGQIILTARQGTTVNLIKALSAFRPLVGEAMILGAFNPQYNSGGIVQALVNKDLALAGNMKVVGTWKEALIVETNAIPAGYIQATVFDGENSSNAGVAFRNHPTFKGLQITSQTLANPIVGKDAQYRRYLGLGVQNRSRGAVLYTTDTTWAEPTFI